MMESNSLPHRPARSMLDLALLLASVSAGLAIAWIDSRPHWDDAGITAGFLLISSGVLGMIAPRRPWLIGLGVGMWFPEHLILQRPTLASVGGGFLILAIPMVGAYAGMVVRRLLAAT